MGANKCTALKNDYSEGAHPRILNALVETNFEQEEGYGEDRYSRQAVELLKERMGRTDVDIHLLAGGTQTNLIAISAFLRPHEAAIAASTGHILDMKRVQSKPQAIKYYPLKLKKGN